MKANCVILAAGKGTRMKTKRPKVLCEVVSKPMVLWVKDNCLSAGFQEEELCFVLGYEAQQVREVIGQEKQFCLQKEQLGTGHAVKQAINFLKNSNQVHTLVLAGDSPFIDKETIRGSYDLHLREKASATVITATLEDPTGYGRIVKDKEHIVRIVEQKDASEEELQLREVNSGAYWFLTQDLLEVLGKLENKNAQNEYYLTDAIGLLIERNKKCCTFISNNPQVILGANDRKSLHQLSKIAQCDIIEKHMENGVEFLDISGVIVGPDVNIGPETVIYPGTILKGNTQIGEGCILGPNSLIENSVIGDETKINASQVYNSTIGANVSVGPFSHIRPNTTLKNKVKVGDFVEVKNSVVGEGTSIAHLTYIGDSDFGSYVNVGCGVVTVNYDGENKFRTTVGDFSFIGCNTNLIAPVTLGEGAYTAAGSTIDKDVPDKALAVARQKQVNYENWAERKLKKYKEKKMKK